VTTTDPSGTATPRPPGTAAPPAPPASPGSHVSAAVVPQRAVLVLPTTAEFDSRTYRIAGALVGRGHDVTVLARWRPGLPEDEQHAAGYRIRRVKVSAGAGLPIPGPVYRAISRSRQRRRDRAAAQAGTTPDPTPVRPPAAGADEGEGPARARPRGLAGRLRAAIASAWRTAAISLVVRSQSKASRDLVPAPDLYHGMAYMGIPVALSLARRTGGRVVYDARDIYVDAGNLALLPRPARALIGRLERGWARRADRVITVNRPYAEVMAARWGVDLPLIVLNCSWRYEPPVPRPRRFHEALGLAPDARVVLYQGGFSRDRGIEQLIAAIPSVRNAVLVLLGYGVLQAELERRAADPGLGGRVRILPAVAPGELLSWVASADVVAMPIQPTTLNHRLTTPNKLFEAMAAGVPVVASDLPGMAGIVRESGAGELVDPSDPVAIAGAVSRILDAPAAEREAYGRRALAAAHETYNWERQVDLLLAEYGRLTGRPW
jgi:glycosyltransferase involved in cell wall biosynthesis